eukprot:54819-Karenia_brevis.AAC.1
MLKPDLAASFKLGLQSIVAQMDNQIMTESLCGITLLRPSMKWNASQSSGGGSGVASAVGVVDAPSH